MLSTWLPITIGIVVAVGTLVAALFYCLTGEKTSTKSNPNADILEGKSTFMLSFDVSFIKCKI